MHCFMPSQLAKHASELFVHCVICRGLLMHAMDPPEEHQIQASFNSLTGDGAIAYRDEKSYPEEHIFIDRYAVTNLGRFLAAVRHDMRFGRLLALADVMGPQYLPHAVVMVAYMSLQDKPYIKPNPAM